MDDLPTVVSFGGGVNSTAMLIAMHKSGKHPDAILFADTGGEKPETYAHVKRMQSWCIENGMPPITVVSYSSKMLSPLKIDFACGSAHASLEDECHNNGTLPSKAFGFGGCSQKWKRYPMDKWVNQWEPAIKAWEAGKKVLRLIGIHAGETRRGKIPDDAKFTYGFPLRILGWAQTESSCWFCPSMRKPEVIELSAKHPDLFARAVDMERNARECDGLDVIKGLGRHWSWEGLVQAHNAQENFFDAFEDLQAPVCDVCVDW